MPWASTLAWATEIVPSARALAVAVSGPRNRALAVRTKLRGRAGTQAQPVPQPGGGRPDLLPLVGAGGAAGIDAGEFLEPVAFQAVHQPPQFQDPLGPDHVTEPVQVLGGQPIHDLGECRQPIPPRVRLPAVGRIEYVFESMAATYQPFTPTQPPNQHLGTTSLPLAPEGLAMYGMGSIRLDRRAR